MTDPLVQVVLTVNMVLLLSLEVLGGRFACLGHSVFPHPHSLIAATVWLRALRLPRGGLLLPVWLPCVLEFIDLPSQGNLVPWWELTIYQPVSWP